MRIDVLTLFPEMFPGVLGSSILKRAAQDITPPGPANVTPKVRKAVVSYHVHDIRPHSLDRHSKVDQPPFGGGPGMVIQCQPVWDAVRAVEALDPRPATRILTTPQGRRFDQATAQRLAQCQRLLILAGHYEGFDERVIQRLDDPAQGGPLCPISLGDFVLSGGELPAMVIIDAVVRLLPEALGDACSTHDESFGQGTGGLLDYPHYTRPRSWEGMEVPPVLLSGDHARIAAWRAQQSRERTARLRPDLMPGDPTP